MDDAELEKLRKEKEELLENSKNLAEADKLRKEIEELKNPKKPKKPMNPKVGKFFKGAFTAAANLGDSVIAVGRNVLSEKPGTTTAQKTVPSKDGTSKKAGTQRTETGKKKYFSNKIAALNDCEKGEQVYYDAKEEVYYVIKYSTAKQPADPSAPKDAKTSKPKKKTDMFSSMDNTMKNINKEINKFDQY